MKRKEEKKTGAREKERQREGQESKMREDVRLMLLSELMFWRS